MSRSLTAGAGRYPGGRWTESRSRSPDTRSGSAWQQVRDNKGAPGVDGQSIAAFEERLEDNLYRVWNRMSSGTWFPPPVRAAVIPKPGGGTRTLGVPTEAA